MDAAAEAVLAQLVLLPDFARLRDVRPEPACDDAMLAEILGGADRFAQTVLAPLNRGGDRIGCALVNGRVITPPGHVEAWQAFVAGGWPTIEAPVEHGGAGLPLVVHSACEELFNRAAPAFGMLATPTRCAVRLLHLFADAAIQQTWLPRLATGEWSAAICISEAEAGSDVGRIRTKAVPQNDGGWAITGEKLWISFGDHDLTPGIGHMLLARTPDAPPGSAGLSLFLVPATLDGARNGVVTRRIEEKLGLHGSPTCALGFEAARGWLIGTRHRGLSQLFTMIVGMRISVGSQGAGIAAAASDIAFAYAAERRQGGSGKAPPVPIARHGDVRRMLLAMAARAEVARGLVLQTSVTSDLASHEADAGSRAEAAALMGWLLPITKNFCAEAGFANASEAIQVLGGAGYTREWPLEQYLRDARVLSIYEGTTGMQAQDLLLRRTLGVEADGYSAFLARAEADMATAPDREAAGWCMAVISALKSSVDHLARAGLPPEPWGALAAGAVPFLRLASLATTGWIALEFISAIERASGAGEVPGVRRRMAARCRHWLRILPALAAREQALVLASDTLLTEYDEAV